MQSASDAAWREQLHTCGVCFDELASLDCVRFVRCSHTFCKSCVRGYFESLMADGAASASTEDDLAESIDASNVEKLVEGERDAWILVFAGTESADLAAPGVGETFDAPPTFSFIFFKSAQLERWFGHSFFDLFGLFLT